MPLYKIARWNELFENNRTRELKRMEWVPIQNKHDSDGYTDLITRPNGLELYGAWVLIVEVASKCTPRGTLNRTIPQEGATIPQEGAPHDAKSIARIVRCTAAQIQAALDACVEIGWITCTGNPLQNLAPSCGNPAPICGLMTMEGKGTELKGSEKKTDYTPANADVAVPKQKKASTEPDPNNITGQTVWAAWVDANRAAKRADPTPLGPQTKAAKTLAVVFGDLDPIKVIFAKYLADKDPFIAKAGHPLAMLPARVDVYRNAGVVQHGSNRGHSNAGYQAPAEDVESFRALCKQKLEESRRRNKALEQTLLDDAVPAVPLRAGGAGQDLRDDGADSSVPY